MEILYIKKDIKKMNYIFKIKNIIQMYALKQQENIENKTETKFDFFQKIIDIDRCDEKTHFLYISEITKEFLEGNEPELPSEEMSVKKADNIMMKKAIYSFYQVLDKGLYNSFTNPKGIVTMIVWGKYKDYQREWKPYHRVIVKGLNKIKKEKHLNIKKSAHIKRQQKEKQKQQQKQLDTYNERKRRREQK